MKGAASAAARHAQRQRAGDGGAQTLFGEQKKRETGLVGSKKGVVCCQGGVLGGGRAGANRRPFFIEGGACVKGMVNVVGSKKKHNREEHTFSGGEGAEEFFLWAGREQRWLGVL